MIKVYSIITFILLFSSCKDTDSDNGTIYFFLVHDMTTTEPIDCESIINLNGLYKLPLSEEITKKLMIFSNDGENNSNYYPDVRYKVSLDKNRSICFDYSGNFVNESGEKGKISDITFLQEYISKYKDKAILVSKEFSEPWNN
jgi:hypothetical protein